MTDRDPTLDEALGRAALAERLAASRGDERAALARRLELVTLERDQLRLASASMASAYEETAAMLRADRQAALDENGRLLDRLEALEAAAPPRPARAEVADFADEQDRLIAANADDRMQGDGPTWEPVLTGRIPTAGGMGAVRVHDPDDPVARAFFLNEHPTVSEAAARVRTEGDVAEASRRRRALALEAQDLHDREAAEQADWDSRPLDEYDEMADPPDPPDEV